LQSLRSQGELEQVGSHVGQQKTQNLGVEPGGRTPVDLGRKRCEIPGNLGRLSPPPGGEL
jgi:hypothetical protein